MPYPKVPRITPENEKIIELYRAKVFDFEDYRSENTGYWEQGVIISSELGLGFVRSVVGAAHKLKVPTEMHARNIRIALQRHINHSFPEIHNADNPVIVYCDGVQRTKLYMQTFFNKPGLEMPYDSARLRALTPTEIVRIEDSLEDCRKNAEPPIRLAYHPLPEQAPKPTGPTEHEQKIERILKAARKCRLALSK